MDAESLLVKPDSEPTSPGAILLGQATAPECWPSEGTCPAGEGCPFCNSQALLSREEHQTALLQILRWYELASGKRWSFRDLFSLVSYLLAGHHPADHSQIRQLQQSTPCEWAANLIDLDQKITGAKKPSRQALTAIFHIVTSSYQQALFHRWDRDSAASLKQDLTELGLEKQYAREEDRTLNGLCHFLQERKAPYLPATIAPLLESLVDFLDPALASPDNEVAGATDYREPLLTWFIHKVPNVTPTELNALGFTSDIAELSDRVKTLPNHHCLYKSFDIAGDVIRGLPFYELIKKT